MDAVAIHRTAHGFDRAAEDYERARPDYPAEAVAWLADRLGLRAGRTVLDLAAGTGKLTRLLLGTGARVIAVEPVAGMRERLAGVLPADDLLEGTAEAIPLADGSVDAVTVAQAFHWFDGDRALAEIHRVTAEGGRLAVVYNRRPLEDPLQTGLEAIMAPHRGETPSERTGRWRDAFARSDLWSPSDTLELRHSTPLAREDVVARVTSVSFISALPPDRRDQVSDEVRALVAAYEEPVAVPYICELFVWDRTPVLSGG
jgi:ubiquinone/menaquinone biosynthesis C-methylase UbiE